MTSTPPPSQIYSAMHLAYADVARAHDLHPIHVRVLVAVFEAGEAPTSDDIAIVLHCQSSGGSSGATALRRALGRLYERELLDGRSSKGGPRRPGTTSVFKLQRSGLEIVQMFSATYEDYTKSIAALRLKRAEVKV